MNDYIKWTLASVAIIFGIALNYSNLVASAPFIVRLSAVLIIFVAGVFIAATTTHGKQAWVFVLSAQNEARKVVWPTRQETIQASIIVVIMVVIMSIILWGFDSALFKILAWFTGQEV
jgi:preprotein translocase subunit SecE